LSTEIGQCYLENSKDGSVGDLWQSFRRRRQGLDLAHSNGSVAALASLGPLHCCKGGTKNLDQAPARVKRAARDMLIF